MNPSQSQVHSDHVRFEQEHLQWNADHLKSLAILRRVEAHLYAHEAEIAAHRAEIARHESALSPRAGAGAALGEAAVHQTMASQHVDAGRNHQRLIDAINALGDLL
jgi:hypothetical protein